MKICPVDPDIICLKDFLNEGVNANDPLKRRNYWTEVQQIYTHIVARSSQMNVFKSEWRYCNPFRNVRGTNKGE